MTPLSIILLLLVGTLCSNVLAIQWYRAVESSEDFKTKGIVASDPASTTTAEEHIAENKKPSPWISLTKDLPKAIELAERWGRPYIVEINPGGLEIFDLTTEADQQKTKRTAIHFSKEQFHGLTKGPIPPGNIKGVVWAADGSVGKDLCVSRRSYDLERRAPASRKGTPIRKGSDACKEIHANKIAGNVKEFFNNKEVNPDGSLNIKATLMALKAKKSSAAGSITKATLAAARGNKTPADKTEAPAKNQQGESSAPPPPPPPPPGSKKIKANIAAAEDDKAPTPKRKNLNAPKGKTPVSRGKGPTPAPKKAPKGKKVPMADRDEPKAPGNAKKAPAAKKATGEMVAKTAKKVSYNAAWCSATCTTGTVGKDSALCLQHCVAERPVVCQESCAVPSLLTSVKDLKLMCGEHCSKTATASKKTAAGKSQVKKAGKK
ncbi:hypothetical protein BC829DRAFT_414474 [Chytridium lagenaria]|nr:hypothetical protein BC829DRAFT_414474 [Chytridium lagenaria]